MTGSNIRSFMDLSIKKSRDILVNYARLDPGHSPVDSLRDVILYFGPQRREIHAL